MASNKDSLGRVVQKGDIIAWATRSGDSGELRYAVVRDVISKNEVDYYGNEQYEIKTIIFYQKWNYNDNTKQGHYTHGVKNSQMYYPNRGIIVTDIVLSVDEPNQELKYLIEARKKLLE
jgi:hypothetical protein